MAKSDLAEAGHKSWGSSVKLPVDLWPFSDCPITLHRADGFFQMENEIRFHLMTRCHDIKLETEKLLPAETIHSNVDLAVKRLAQKLLNAATCASQEPYGLPAFRSGWHEAPTLLPSPYRVSTERAPLIHL